MESDTVAKSVAENFESIRWFAGATSEFFLTDVGGTGASSMDALAGRATSG